MDIRRLRAVNKMGKDFNDVIEEKSRILAKQDDYLRNAIEAIANARVIEDSSAAMKEINLCIVTYWINTLAFLRNYGINSSLLIAMTIDKKQEDLENSLKARLTQDLLIQQNSNFYVCSYHFSALEEIFYFYYLDGMEATEFKELQSFVASKGVEEFETSILVDFVSDKVKKAICNSLTEHYLELMDQAKNYLAEQSFYPDKANYLDESKETIVQLFEICAFTSDEQSQPVNDFLRQKFEWQPSLIVQKKKGMGVK